MKKNKKELPVIYSRELVEAIFKLPYSKRKLLVDSGVIKEKTAGRYLADLEKIGPAVTDLWMPHSVMRINGKLSYLNSMKSELYNGSMNKLATFRGFTRGLAHDGKYFFVATTGHRYPEKLVNILDNISLDCGFYMFDEKSKMSKFYSVDSCESVHSLIVI